MQLGIALYKLSKVESGVEAVFYHWALATYKERGATHAGLYELITPDRDGAKEVSARRDSRLATSAHIIGIVHLGPITELSEEHLHEWLSQQRADPQDYRLDGHKWTCATFCLRGIRDLIDTGLLNIDATDADLYYRVLQTGAVLEQHGRGRGGQVPTVDIVSD
ncbi:hypothetical protein A0H81_01624 [Grifola frondosa]|uniref:Uncharacterized protein n=1 Tax=Grifola frondosa TaxID=5627 RepID=A0A1C7ML77_GRIFR|nr:hypothetical protein A0H81_01624 [Grifola frondosa]